MTNDQRASRLAYALRVISSVHEKDIRNPASVDTTERVQDILAAIVALLGVVIEDLSFNEKVAEELHRIARQLTMLTSNVPIA
jgi:SepF-like predicted cell division protein (DUF552 family)